MRMIDIEVRITAQESGIQTHGDHVGHLLVDVAEGRECCDADDLAHLVSRAFARAEAALKA